MDGQFKLGELTLKLTKGNNSDVNVEYSLGKAGFTDKIELGEMKKFAANIKRYVDDLYSSSSNSALKYIDPKTAEKLKALGIKDLSYIARGFGE